MKVFKSSRLGLLLFLCLALCFMMAACKDEGALAPQSTESEASLQAAEAAPSSEAQADTAPGTTGEADAERVSDMSESQESDPQGEAAGHEEASAPMESGRAEIKETGPELKPDSQFALLEAEQQDELIEMMEKMQSAYASLGDAFETLGQHESELLNALQKGEGIASLDSFSAFKEKAAAALDQLAVFENQNLSELAQKLYQSSASVSSWYKDFISQLENQDSSDLSGFRSWIEGKRSEASDLIQGFLDTVQSLYQ